MVVEPTEFINVLLVFDGVLLVGTNFRVILRTNFDHQDSSVRVLLKNCASVGTTVWHIQSKSRRLEADQDIYPTGPLPAMTTL